MILLSKTYETWDEDALEDSRGFVWEDIPHTFHELLDLLEDEFINCSCLPVTTDVHTWFHTEPDQDFRTGEETTYSLHYSRKNEPKTAKYWAKAIAYVQGGKRK